MKRAVLMSDDAATFPMPDLAGSVGMLREVLDRHTAQFHAQEDRLWRAAFRQRCSACGRGPRWIWQTWRATRLEAAVHVMCDAGHRRCVGVVRLAVDMRQQRIGYQVRIE